MKQEDIARIKELAANNYELRKLWDEHVALDIEIEKLQLHNVSGADDQQVKELQKKKLAGKDRLFELMRELDG